MHRLFGEITEEVETGIGRVEAIMCLCPDEMTACGERHAVTFRGIVNGGCPLYLTTRSREDYNVSVELVRAYISEQDDGTLRLYDDSFRTLSAPMSESDALILKPQPFPTECKEQVGNVLLRTAYRILSCGINRLRLQENLAQQRLDKIQQDLAKFIQDKKTIEGTNSP